MKGPPPVVVPAITRQVKGHEHGRLCLSQPFCVRALRSTTRLSCCRKQRGPILPKDASVLSTLPQSPLQCQALCTVEWSQLNYHVVTSVVAMQLPCFAQEVIIQGPVGVRWCCASSHSLQPAGTLTATSAIQRCSVMYELGFMCLCNVRVAFKGVTENLKTHCLRLCVGVQNNLKGANGNGIGNNNVGVFTAPQPHWCFS